MSRHYVLSERNRHCGCGVGTLRRGEIHCNSCCSILVGIDALKAHRANGCVYESNHWKKRVGQSNESPR